MWPFCIGGVLPGRRTLEWKLRIIRTRLSSRTPGPLGNNVRREGWMLTCWNELCVYSWSLHYLKRKKEKVSKSEKCKQGVEWRVRQRALAGALWGSVSPGPVCERSPLCSSAWSYRTGKRRQVIVPHLATKLAASRLTSEIDLPSSGRSEEKEREKSSTEMLNKSIEQGLNLSGS